MKCQCFPHIGFGSISWHIVFMRCMFYCYVFVLDVCEEVMYVVGHGNIYCAIFVVPFQFHADIVLTYTAVGSAKYGQLIAK